MAEQKPSLGRIVHYQSHGSPNGQHSSQPRAAIITSTYEGTPFEVEQRVDLCVLNPTGMYFDKATPFDAAEIPAPGTWHWPPRV